MREFILNGYKWRMVRVGPTNPALIDRSGRLALATTEPQSKLICVSDAVYGELLGRVVAHEVAHAAIVSYGLADDVARFSRPGATVEAEEWCCGFMAEYGPVVLAATSDLLSTPIRGFLLRKPG